MKKLFKQFSFPAVYLATSHPKLPGSINEGGELGYSLSMPTALRSTTPI